MTKSILAFQFITDEPKVAKFKSAADMPEGWFAPETANALAFDAGLAPSTGMIALYNLLVPENPIKKFSDRTTAARRLWAVAEERAKEHTEMEYKPQTEEEVAHIPENLSEKLKQATEDQKKAREEAAAEKARLAEEKKAAAEAKKAEREAAKAKKEEERAAAKAKREEERAAKKAEREAARAAAGTAGRASTFKGKIIKRGTAIKEGENGGWHNPRREGSFGYTSMQIILDAPSDGISYDDFIKAGGRSNDLRWDIEHGNAVVEDAPAAE